MLSRCQRSLLILPSPLTDLQKAIRQVQQDSSRVAEGGRHAGKDLGAHGGRRSSPLLSKISERTIVWIIAGMVVLAVLSIVYYAIARYVGYSAALAVMFTAGAVYLSSLGVWYCKQVRRESCKTSGSPTGPPPHFHSEGRALNRAETSYRNRLVRELQSHCRVELLAKLHPSDFEAYVLQYYAALGFESTRLADPIETGANAILRNGTTRVLLRCLQGKSQVSQTEVRNLACGVSRELCHSAVFVTTSSFDSAAQRYARDTNVELFDGERFSAAIGKLRCLDPQTGQQVDLPLFPEDALGEFTFARHTRAEIRKSRIPQPIAAHAQ